MRLAAGYTWVGIPPMGMGGYTTHEDLEEALGYSIENMPILTEQHFYSDLQPVPLDVKARTRYEHKKLQKIKQELQGQEMKLVKDIGPEAKEFRLEDSSVTVKRCTNFGLFPFSIAYARASEPTLHLLLSQRQTEHLLASLQLSKSIVGTLPPIFEKLPKELRDAIYDEVFPAKTVTVELQCGSRGSFFPQTIGQPDGFLFPARDCSSLQICTALRHELLPIAYRNTVFKVDNIDAAIMLLIGIGTIGRHDLTGIDIFWTSESYWAHRKNRHDIHGSELEVPGDLHTELCVRLLKECVRLRTVRLRFYDEFMSYMSLEEFQKDLGIQQLVSLKGIKNIEVLDYFDIPLDEHVHVQWLKQEMAKPS